MDSMGDVLQRVVDRAALPPISCAALDAGRVGMEQANDNLARALTRLYWNKPYMLAELLVDTPCWPCGHSLEDLLFLCRVKLAEQKNAAGYTAISLRAADKCLVKLIAAAADLERRRA